MIAGALAFLVLIIVIVFGVAAVLRAQNQLEATNRRLDTNNKLMLECLQRVRDGQHDPELDAYNTLELVRYNDRTSNQKEI